MSVATRALPCGPDRCFYRRDGFGRWMVLTPYEGPTDLREYVREAWKRRHGAFPPEQVLTGSEARYVHMPARYSQPGSPFGI